LARFLRGVTTARERHQISTAPAGERMEIGEDQPERIFFVVDRLLELFYFFLGERRELGLYPETRKASTSCNKTR